MGVLSTSDANLVGEFTIDGAGVEDLLGLDDDDDDDSEGGGSGEDSSDEDSDENMNDEEFLEFQRHTRVTETRRTEENRRPGGIKTQRAVVKAWTVHSKAIASLKCTHNI